MNPLNKNMRTARKLCELGGALLTAGLEASDSPN